MSGQGMEPLLSAMAQDVQTPHSEGRELREASPEHPPTPSPKPNQPGQGLPLQEEGPIVWGSWQNEVWGTPMEEIITL